MKSSGGTKVQEGVVSATLRGLCLYDITSTRTYLWLSRNLKFNSKQQLTAEEQQQMSACLLFCLCIVFC